MAHRDMHESGPRMADTGDRVHERKSQDAANGAGIVDYLGLLGLALAAILLVGLVSTFLFGSSVSTSL